MIEAKIVNLAITDKGFAIILKPEGYEKVVPIFIGTLEAQSISMVLLGLLQPRPLTHDLFKNVIDKFEIDIEKIVVDDIRNDTFYAKIVFSQNQITLRVDSRPSDAIAMALRMKAPIFIEEKVADEAGIHLDEQDGKISFKESFPVNFKEELDAKSEESDVTLKSIFQNAGKETGEKKTSAMGNEQNGQSESLRPLSKIEELEMKLSEAIKEERYEDAAEIRDEIEKIDKNG